MYKELLLGCGRSRVKKIIHPETPDQWQNLTTLDFNSSTNPDVLMDLDNLTMAGGLAKGVGFWRLLDDEFDEIHAYEVVEHLGSQGNFRSFFRFFEWIWNGLKPNGLFCATVPSRFSPWLWGDPGHCRAILPETLVFLSQPEYTRQVGKTAMSDYRNVYTADFDIVRSVDDRTTHSFILRAVKPSRISV